jgi:hypothetical protein
LERRAPPTFDVLIEIQTRDKLVVIPDVAAAVDGMLRGRPLPVEQRTRDEQGEVHIDIVQPEVGLRNGNDQGFTRTAAGRMDRYEEDEQRPARRSRDERRKNGMDGMQGERRERDERPSAPAAPSTPARDYSDRQPLKLHAYGIARNRLVQAAKRLHVPLEVTDDPGRADAVMTLKNLYRRRPKVIADAERRGMPIYVLRANTVSQMEDFLIDLFRLEVSPSDPFGEALQEVEQGIAKIQAGAAFVDLLPQSATIRRRQHQLARESQVNSKSYGEEPQRFVRLFRE